MLERSWHDQTKRFYCPSEGQLGFDVLEGKVYPMRYLLGDQSLYDVDTEPEFDWERDALEIFDEGRRINDNYEKENR